MNNAVSFGLAFGSLVFVRALLDGGAAGIPVTVVMFSFFAGVSAVAFLAVSLLGRRPFLTALLTAFLLLTVIVLPGLFRAPLNTLTAARIGVRFVFAWAYTAIAFAALSRMVTMKTSALK